MKNQMLALGNPINQLHRVIQDSEYPTTTSHSDQIARFRILIDILRVAEKDYLAKDTPSKHRLSAKIILFKDEAFRKACKRLGLDCDMARLHIILWKQRGRVGDPVFGFLSQAGAYETYVKGKRLPIPDYARLKRETRRYGHYSSEHRSCSAGIKGN